MNINEVYFSNNQVTFSLFGKDIKLSPKRKNMKYKLVVHFDYVDNIQEIKEKLESLGIDVRETYELDAEFIVDITTDQLAQIDKMVEFEELVNLEPLNAANDVDTITGEATYSFSVPSSTFQIPNFQNTSNTITPTTSITLSGNYTTGDFPDDNK